MSRKHTEEEKTSPGHGGLSPGIAQGSPHPTPSRMPAAAVRLAECPGAWRCGLGAWGAGNRWWVTCSWLGDLGCETPALPLEPSPPRVCGLLAEDASVQVLLAHVEGRGQAGKLSQGSS